jgi:hypothetical protein
MNLKERRMAWLMLMSQLILPFMLVSTRYAGRFDIEYGSRQIVKSNWAVAGGRQG